MFILGYYDDRDKLRDWPTAGSDPRSPKYLFHKENPIYVQVRGLGQNLTQETSPNAVRVTSESGGPLYLDLKETSGGSQTFRNSWAPNGELLYLADGTSEGYYKDTIKVQDEEVLNFELRCPLIGAIASYEDSNDVMVDRAEVGVEWQCDYDRYDPGDPGEPPFGTLDCADDYALGFMQNLGWPEVPLNPYSWWDVFANGDLASQEAHWDSAGDSCYADNVDFAAWCGHGTRAHQLPRILRFFVDLIGGEKQPPDKLAWSEIQWGDEDLDWVVLNTCRFLDGTDVELKQMASGVHLICGYQTDMTVYAAAGEYFADLMDTTGDSVRVAWHQQCQHYQPRGNTARVFGASQCVMDGVRAGGGPIFVSRDPTSSSSYSHWDRTAE